MSKKNKYVAKKYKKTKEIESRINQWLRPETVYVQSYGNPAAYNYPLNFSKTGTDRDPIFLGLEWEVIDNRQGGRHNTLKLAAKECPELFYYVDVGYDGGGHEFRTVPATLRFHKEQIQRLFFDTNVAEFFTSKPQSGTGIHVHIDKKTGFKNNQKLVNKFLMFFACKDNHKFIDAIAQRKFTGVGYPSRLDFVIPQVDDKTGRMNGKANYNPASCFRAAAPYSDTYLSTEIVYEKDLTIKNVTSRTSINLFGKNSKTIEVRYFNSSHTADTLFSKLELCDALCRYIRTCDYSELYVPEFLTWVRRHESRYANLLSMPICAEYPSVSKKSRVTLTKRLVKKAQAKASKVRSAVSKARRKA